MYDYYREQTDEPKSVNIFTYICMLAWYVRAPIFIQIVHILDLDFQGHGFESRILRSSYANISQIVTDRTNISIANTESRMNSFNWHIYI